MRISSMENIKKIESKSYESLSTIAVQLTSNADADVALNDAQRKVNAVLGNVTRRRKTTVIK